MKITHAPHLPNILIFLTFSRRGSQQAVVKGHKRGVTRYCIYADPTSQMAMCSFLHLLTHSFIHSRAPSPGLILDIQEQVIKTHCLPWGAPSFWSGMGGGVPSFASQPLIIQPGCSCFYLSYLPFLAPGGGHPARGPSTPGPLRLSSPPLYKGRMSGSRRGFYRSAGTKRGSLYRGGPSNRGGGFHTTSPLHQAARWTPCLLGTHVLPPCSGLGSGAIAQGTLFSPLPMPAGAPTCP